MFAAHITPPGDEHWFDGRSSILFATVAGVSIGLLTGGAQPSPRDEHSLRRISIAIRGAALMLIGILMTTLLQPPLAVILDYYGLAFLLLVPLIFARRLVLSIATVLVVALAPPVVGWLRADVDPNSIPLVAIPFANWLVFGTYPVLIWLAFPMIGLLCARAGLERRRTHVLMIACGTVAAVAGYSAGAFVPGLTAEAHSGSVAEVIGSGGVAIAVIGIATFLGSIGGAVGRLVRGLLYPVAAAGGMALTLYVVHAIGVTIVRDAVDTEATRWSYPDATLPILIVSALLVATIWRLLLGAGPLERGLRWLTALPSPRSPVADNAAPRV